MTTPEPGPPVDAAADPDDVLARAVRLAAWLVNDQPEDALAASQGVLLARLFRWLNGHLANAGPLPYPWAQAAEPPARRPPRRPVADVPLPGAEPGPCCAEGAWVRASWPAIRQALFDAEDYRDEHDLPRTPDREYTRLAEQFSEFTRD
jgi:hypothetical protein